AVEEALDELAPLLLPRAVAIERPREWPRVRYPRTELGQLVTNLISNAGKWAGKGGEPVVHISWRHEQDAVVLSVADNGPGVPPELRSRVFEIFRKLDPASPGTGVGLAIVKRIAERHGGQVWVEDAPRLGGASFAVTLPQA
ncbi:MAG TPA: HAMP domain-containing sensor histidine kinase, partial [Deinococcales bacterium]|nr:HAMP domain-containing sensor histidine kinase [Deinococcales bacterium]